MVEPLAKAAPVIQDHVQVKVPGGDLGLAALQLLQAPLSQHKGSTTCSRHRAHSSSLDPISGQTSADCKSHMGSCDSQIEEVGTKGKNSPGGAPITFCDPEYMQSTPQASP